MGDKTDHIVEEFQFGELVQVAEALGLAPTSHWGSRKVVDAIRVKLMLGVPEDEPDDDKIAELLDDFLYVDGWIDEQGEIIRGGEQYPSDVVEFLKEKKLGSSKDDLPKCYGYADDADPECGKCPVYAYCAMERLLALPSCFAHLFDAGDPECQGCLEAPYCKPNNSK